jgi:acyl dehydratase
VAHGFLTLSLLASTGFEVLLQRVEVQQALNYGLEKVRFLAPVRAGKRVRNHVKVTGVEHKSSGRVLLTTENTFEIEGEDKPALVALFLAMVMN